MRILKAIIYFPIIWFVSFFNRIIVVDLISPIIQIILELFISPLSAIFQIIVLPICLIIDIPIGLIWTLIMAFPMTKDMIEEDISLMQSIRIIFGANDMRIFKKRDSDIEEYELIEDFSSVDEMSIGKKIRLKGRVTYTYPAHGEEGRVSIHEPYNRRTYGGWWYNVEFRSTKELRKLFPKEALEKKQYSMPSCYKIDSSDFLISTEDEVVICGTLAKGNAKLNVKIVDAFIYKE